MTDIRKDCMEAYKKAFKKYAEDWSDDDHPLMREEVDAYKCGFADGYQAGRAHDVDGLIAEMMSLQTSGSNAEADLAVAACISIIRKHFGKE